MWNSSIWLIDGTLSFATTRGQSGPGSNGNERVLCIPQSSSITGASLSDCLVSYPGHTEMQSGYFTAPANNVIDHMEVWSIQWNKTGFLLNARFELHKKAMSYLEQILETIPPQNNSCMATYRPFQKPSK